MQLEGDVSLGGVGEYDGEASVQTGQGWRFDRGMNSVYADYECGGRRLADA
jgi:hypothetical protein